MVSRVARLTEHERSKTHLEAALAVVRRSHELGRIECVLAKQMTQAVQYWRSVLKRVFSVVVFISERGLAFRGSDEVIDSVNNGNSLLE